MVLSKKGNLMSILSILSDKIRVFQKHQSTNNNGLQQQQQMNVDDSTPLALALKSGRNHQPMDPSSDNDSQNKTTKKWKNIILRAQKKNDNKRYSNRIRLVKKSDLDKRYSNRIRLLKRSYLPYY